MCTVIVGYKIFPHYPIVIAANRDELLDRPSEPPKRWEGEPAMLAPVDMQRGGTWIGVNAHGVFAALTNRVDVPSIGGQRSRGELVLKMLKFKTAKEAVLKYSWLDASAYNGFHLIIGDRHSLHTLHGSGANYGEAWRGPTVNPVIRGLENSTLLIVTNVGVGPDTHRGRSIMSVWNGERAMFQSSKPASAAWGRLLDIHEEIDPDPDRKKFAGSTCIHRPAEENYGTKSSAFITLSGAGWQYEHRERPEDGHACQGEWDPVRTLPINE